MKRPLLRRKPAFRCLKTVANIQRQDIPSEQTQGKSSISLNETKKRERMTNAALTKIDSGTTAAAEDTTNHQSTHPPQPATTSIPGWYFGVAYHGHAIIWSNGIVTACPAAMFQPYSMYHHHHVYHGYGYFFWGRNIGKD
ncbi:hypothetical protein BR93DRAFT_931811 [Coniochaeta sp. PMI_546]|nr:hypothetical protein BR93DRAFT_931811 [Coniochaeta sp. PMI_546]